METLSLSLSLFCLQLCTSINSMNIAIFAAGVVIAAAAAAVAADLLILPSANGYL